ncbi:MAG: hypothetical protein P4L55_08085 [Syntrophobacteraceae bacterium]|nr:hypothetical protein [Syntrophobacteraceae bacterium]
MTDELHKSDSACCKNGLSALQAIEAGKRPPLEDLAEPAHPEPLRPAANLPGLVTNAIMQKPQGSEFPPVAGL